MAGVGKGKGDRPAGPLPMRAPLEHLCVISMGLAKGSIHVGLHPILGLFTGVCVGRVSCGSLHQSNVLDQPQLHEARSAPGHKQRFIKYAESHGTNPGVFWGDPD